MHTRGEINTVLTVAETPQQFKEGESLFREYAASLDIDLAFQGFEKELTEIDRQYNKPYGALIIAYANDIAIGCAGVRRLDDDTAELKRMFVNPAYRGQNIAVKMLVMATDIAKSLNYKAIRLDTIPSMKHAQSLYISQGFYEITPYRFNPVKDTIYMEKRLG